MSECAANVEKRRKGQVGAIFFFFFFGGGDLRRDEEKDGECMRVWYVLYP